MTYIGLFTRFLSRHLFLAAAVVIALSAVSTGTVAAAQPPQKHFSSPEKAVEALVAALKANKRKELLAIFGPGSKPIVSSGDKIADRANRARFLKLYEEKYTLEGADTGRATVIIGDKEYRFPVPLVKQGSLWHFDAMAGRNELLNRRIGRNELEAIAVLREYVTAQREYAAQDRDGDGNWEFARKFRSTPGKKDGLYWEANEGEPESPFGALVAQATQEGYLKEKKSGPQPFHGYYFKILTAQGANAEGGAFDYMVNGKLLLGYALVAYPARYGVSGIMTFIVNQNGIVLQKDLGQDTGTIASGMKEYDPDAGWSKVEEKQ